MMATTTETPRVWVGTWGLYNAGALIGGWFDADEAPTDGAAFLEAIGAEQAANVHRVAAAQGVSAANICEEVWCFDLEGFGGLLTGECSPSEARRIAELIADAAADGVPVEVLAGWKAHTGETLEEWDAPTADAVRGVYVGEWESFSDFEDETVEEYLRGLIDAYGISDEDAANLDVSGSWRNDLAILHYAHPSAPNQWGCRGVHVFRNA